MMMVKLLGISKKSQREQQPQKQPSEQERGKAPKSVDETLVYFTLLMFGISTGQIQPSDLVRTAGNATHYGYYAKMMGKIYTLGVKWQYGLAKASEIVAKEVQSGEFRLLLMKMAQVLRLGEEMSTFFRQELDAVISGYIAAYERSMKSMEILLEMYSTMMSTSSFMVASMMILMMVSGGGTSSGQIAAVMMTILAGLSAFVFLSYVMFPRDKFMTDEKSAAAAKLKMQVLMALGMSVGIGVALGFTHVVPVPLAIAAAGGPLLLPGFKAKKLEGEIRKLDDYYSSFARHLGDVYSTVGSLGQSLKSVLRSDFGILSKHIESMHNRVANRIKIEDAFKLLSSDTGSAIISSSNEVLANSMIKGANMRDVGERLSETAAKFLEIRRKRQQSAKAFESTLLMMHVLTLAVFALMNKLLGFLQQFFSLQQNLVGSAQSAVSLSAIDPALMAIILPVEAVALAGINAMALKVFQGGSFHTIWYTIAILLITGGVVLFGVEMMLNNLLQSITLGTNLGALTN